MYLYREEHLTETALGDPVDKSGKDTFGLLLALIAHGTAFRSMERGSFSE